jgi:NAD(P)-dependent dehydrogenase (short-subunit alcohol dehydrogenase family)
VCIRLLCHLVLTETIGLGFETVKKLASSGANVILACRTLSKGQDAKEKMIADVGRDLNIDVMELDLASFKSIRAFAETYRTNYGHVDVLINNAGVMALPDRQTTEDGLEAQIGTNHFGHFLLTSLMFPLISSNGRVINHSSGAHVFAYSGFPYTNLQSTISYEAWGQYGNSKAANLLFTYELNRRLAAKGNPKNIQSIAVHPGYSATNLQAGKYPMWEQANYLFAMSAEHGAQSQLVAAVGRDVSPQKDTFIGPQFLGFGPARVQSILRTYGEEAQQYLWEESLRVTGTDFGGL